jgi:hypothetical protein
VIYAVLLRPLPFRDPQRLVQLWESTPILPQLQATVPDFEDWRNQTHSFSQMAAYTFQEMNRITLVGKASRRSCRAPTRPSICFPPWASSHCWAAPSAPPTNAPSAPWP